LRLDELDCLYRPPRLQEIPVSSLFQEIKSNPRLMRYFPDTNRAMDKGYFFSVIASQAPDFYKTILEQIRNRRVEAEPEAEKVEIHPNMKTLLEQNLPYVGAKEKVGLYVKGGRKWTSPGPRKIPQFQISRLF